MIKIFHVAVREFLATVATKTFVISMVLPILLTLLAAKVLPMLMDEAAPKVTGHIAIVDHSGDVADRVVAAMAKATAEERTKDPVAMATDLVEKSGVSALQPEPQRLTLQVLSPDTNVDEAKAQILKSQQEMSKGGNADARLALAIIPRSSVEGTAKGGFDDFELFTAPQLDVEVQRGIERQIGAAIVDARINLKGMDPDEIRALTDRPRGNVKAVTAEGDKLLNDAAKMLIPAAFMFLLWISTFTCGQYLLTSTIEEKSSRVMEVILSAVSPMQLLTGKVLGQMAVGFVILIVYCGMGVAGLFIASMMSLLPFSNIIYLFVYFFIAFFLIASLMAAVGSAVSDIKEAQSLLGPIMVILMIPMILWLPILRNPNSSFAQVCSFMPFISPFVMILRLSGSEAVPAWQIPASIVFGLITILISLWAAAKIFRIGVLMYGKPPNFKTLIRWIRMA